MAIDVSALIDYAQELEDETAGSGLTWLQARRAEALAAMNGTGDSAIISTTIDGQTYQRTVRGTAADMFSAFQAAIKSFTGQAARITYPTFSGIPL
jgi:hypothetical protein